MLNLGVCAKFEVSSISRCGYILWWPWPRPFQGRFFIGRVGLAMVNQCSALEVFFINDMRYINPRFTYLLTYLPNLKSLGSPVTKLWLAVQNAENGVLWGGKRALKVLGNASASDFIFDFNRIYVSIFSVFENIAGHLSKVADFDPPHLYLIPP